MAHVLNTVHSPNNLELPPDRSPSRDSCMSVSQRALWDRIAAFEIGDASWSLSFGKRLARENGWSMGFAARVVAEYKRFVFLMMEAGHPVTPSDEVDQAWHLHMVYTRSYWDEMCGELLGRPLHHGPTKGGAAEGAKFEDWYARTLASYERLFGERPPAEIWPDARTRFGRAPQFSRVNTSENWVVPKPRVRRSAVGGGLMLVAAGGLAGCGVVLAQSGGAAGIDVAVVIAVVAGSVFLIGGIAAVVRSVLQNMPRRDGGRDGGSHTHTSGCSTFPHAGMTGCSTTGQHGHHGHHGSHGSHGSHGHEGHHGGHGHGDGASDGSGGGGAGSSDGGSSDGGGSDGGSSDGGSSGCSSSGCGGGGCGGGGGD